MATETEAKTLLEPVVIGGVEHVINHPQEGFYLIAIVDESVAGCLMITREWSDWRNGLFWWIQSVYVLPEFRRKGVFKSLYQTADRKARQAGNVCGLRLYVEEHNQQAQAVYKFLGMENTGYRVFESKIN